MPDSTAASRFPPIVRAQIERFMADPMRCMPSERSRLVELGFKPSETNAATPQALVNKALAITNFLGDLGGRKSMLELALDSIETAVIAMVEEDDITSSVEDIHNAVDLLMEHGYSVLIKREADAYSKLLDDREAGVVGEDDEPIPYELFYDRYPG